MSRGYGGCIASLCRHAAHASTRCAAFTRCTVVVPTGQNDSVNSLDLSQARADHHLVDVREDDEWLAGRIEGSQHIPLGELGERLGDLPTGQRIVAVCRSGSRSGAAVRGLRQLGYDAENLEGGVTAWTKAGLPLVDEAGRPGRVI